MKKLIAALAIGVLLATLIPFSASAQRGDLYGGRALLALEQAFKTTGVLTYPNYAAAPVVCNAANRGVYYYDTTLTQARVCGAAGWLTVGGAGLTAGTAATIPKWNAVPDDLVDTLLVEAGVPAAGAGGAVLAQTGTVNAMDNNDTISFIDLIWTDANHTGVNNFMNGVNVWGIIGDDQATSRAFVGGTGWDAILWANTATLTMGSDLNYITFLDDTLGGIFAFDLEHDPTANHTWEWVIGNAAIMTGDDFITRGLWVDITNANHTNAGGNDNFVRGIDIDGIVADAQAIEYAINIGDGWDAAINIAADGSTAINNITLGANAEGTIFFNTANELKLNNSVSGVGIVLNGGTGTARSTMSFNSAEHFSVGNRPAAGTGGAIARVLGPLTAMNGSDTTQMLFIDITNADHTGASNFLYGIDIDGITADADATEAAINIGTGWDALFRLPNSQQNIDLVGTSSLLAIRGGAAGSANRFLIYSADSASNVLYGNTAGLNANGTMLNLNIATLAMNGSDIQRGLEIDITTNNHTGASNFLYGLDIDGITGDAQATETAINIGTGWDYAIATTDDVPINFGTDDDFSMYFNGGGDEVLVIGDNGIGGYGINFVTPDNNAVGIGNSTADVPILLRPKATYISVTDTTATMDGSDTSRGVYLNFNIPDHTGASNFFYGLDIDGITADADAIEAAVHLDASWDYALWVDGTTQDIDHGLTTAVMLSPVLTANDNANDSRNVITIDVAIPNGSAGLINGINFDAVTDDVDTIDSAIFVEAGWDYAMTITDRGGVATNNPLTGTIGIFLDDDADYSGGGGNDCALIARDNGGTNTVIATITLNGACP